MTTATEPSKKAAPKRTLNKLTLPPSKEILEAARSCVKTRATVDVRGIMAKLNYSYTDAVVIAKFLKQGK